MKHATRLQIVRRPIESLESRLLFDATSLLASMPPVDSNINADMDGLFVAGGHTFFTSGRNDRGEALFVASASPDAPPTQLLVGRTFYNDGDPNFGITAQTVFHNKLYFLSNGPSGDGLYVSDGTLGGTAFVKQLRPLNSANVLPPEMFMLDGSLYFFFQPGPYTPQQLFRSDGTAQGTTSVWTAPQDTVLKYVSSVDGTAYISSKNVIYKMASGDTTPQKFISNFDDQQDNTTDVVRAGNSLYYVSKGFSSQRIYASDLNGSNVRRAFDLDQYYIYWAGGVLPVGDRIVFEANDPNTGNPAIFSSSGTVASQTELIQNTNYAKSLGALAPLNSSSAIFSIGNDLFTTDGTVAGTKFLTSTSSDILSTPFVAGDKVFYKLATTGGVKLIKTDGTAAGTRVLQYLFPEPLYDYHNFRGVVDGQLVFDLIRWNDPETDQLWKLDPNAATGSISGAAFTDQTRDNLYQQFEPTIYGMAYIDSNDDGQYEPGELNISDRKFSFDNLVVGTYHVRFVPNSGAATTEARTTVINLTAGQSIREINFIRPATSNVVWGQVYLDANGNGVRDPGEAGIAGQQLYIDVPGRYPNETSAEDSVVTAADGTYGLTGVAAGTAIVRRVDKAGFVQSSPTSRGTRSVVVATGTSTKAADFGVTARAGGTVIATIFLDRNSNHILDGADATAGNGTFFADSNGDGIWQNSVEPYANIASDGTYKLTLAAEPVTIAFKISGTATITPAIARNVQVVSGGAIVLPPLLETVATVGTLPPGKISGSAFIDRNGNSVRDAGEPAASGILAFLDSDNDGVLDPGERRSYTDSAGSYAFPYTANGDYHVVLATPSGWTRTTAALPTTTTLSNAQPTATLGDTGLVSGDTTAPVLFGFNYDADARKFTLTFSEDVTATLVASAVSIVRKSNGQAVALPANTLVSASPGSTTATITLGASIGSGLFTLKLQSITDRSGNALPPTSRDFGTLAGDANGDGVVNFDDLVILAQNYNKTGRSFSQGNLDYDAGGSVNFDDLVVLAQHYGKSLAAIGTPNAPAAPTSTSSTSKSKPASRVSADVLAT